MKTIQLKCEQCGTLFERELKFHIYRTVKLGKKAFCSRSCSTTYRNRHMPKEFYQQNAPRMRKLAGNKRDEFSPFRHFICQCHSRHRACDFDVQYLKELWDTQHGVCPYTGFDMELSRKSNSLNQASLDRIDSTKEYLKGNVEFVCLFINLAKNKFSREDVVEFMKKLKTGTVEQN